MENMENGLSKELIEMKKKVYPKIKELPRDLVVDIAKIFGQYNLEISLLQKEVSRLSEAEDLLQDAYHLLDDIHGYDTDTYRAITEYFHEE